MPEVGSDLAQDAAALPLVDLGRQLNIVGGPPESPMPLNVGLLFFNAQPERFFPATQIDVVWFPDGPGGDVFEEKTFKGPLHRMLVESLDYIRRNYINETVVKHPDRAEATRAQNFPYAAVEELVVNAIYHRSYEEREPVEVRITPQELSVLSFPGPDRSIQLDQLREGRAVSRRYRNRRIGEFLKELELTEGRATGIPKVLRAMRENGSPSPAFETDEGRTSFLARLPAHPRVASPLSRGAKATGGELTPPVTPPVTPQVSGTEPAILIFCLEPRTAQQIRRHLGLLDRKHFTAAYLDPMLECGWLMRTVPDKPRSRLQRYQTTEAGKAHLASLG
jgi:ATP-dependent DNA helicase RecG